MLKNFAIFALFFSVFIYELNAATWRSEKSVKTVCQKGKCTDYCDIDGHLLEPGESIKTNQCTEIVCHSDFSSSGYSCGIAVLNGCKMSPDYSKKYPECCNKICLEENKRKN
ncbi:hypothetical protein PVAND_011927 [Polypedilum vanderplanki]|uniref:Single domain-containing protein n=1 Tax=Polypedilum vanderplanki TaxID=319348 RepID=A0A9J6CLV2_POLVA|nr:hypothetical protein PVAND_011927 [Polypedilum vanderplanki]